MAGAGAKCGWAEVRKLGKLRGTGRGGGGPRTATQKQIPRFARNDSIGTIGNARRLAIAIIGLLALAPSLLYGQVAPKRLSDWLLEQPISPNDYPLGLSWRVPGEVGPQGELRLGLLRSLTGLDPEVKADSEAVARLRDLVRTFPFTGRVPVVVPDARWLQANPARDPMLQPGHSVELPKRPRTVTVITARGERCLVTHAAGREAMAYVEACGRGNSKSAELARSHPLDWASSRGADWTGLRGWKSPIGRRSRRLTARHPVPFPSGDSPGGRSYFWRGMVTGTPSPLTT